MSKFGAGFGKDEHLLDARPCRTTQSAQNQKHFSRRLETDIFSGTSFQDPRPTWWRNEDNTVVRVPSPSRLGEWRLIWRAKETGVWPCTGKSGAETPGPGWGKEETRFDVVGSGPLLRGYADHLNLVESRGPSRGASRQARTATASRRAHSALGHATGAVEAGEAEGGSSQALGTGRVNVDSLRERNGIAASHRSLGSRASRRSRASTVLSDHSSAASISSSAILSRLVGRAMTYAALPSHGVFTALLCTVQYVNSSTLSLSRSLLSPTFLVLSSCPFLPYPFWQNLQDPKFGRRHQVGEDAPRQDAGNAFAQPTRHG